MNDNNIEKIKKIYDYILDKANAIYDIFKYNFGEKNVDLQLRTKEDFIRLFNFSVNNLGAGLVNYIFKDYDEVRRNNIYWSFFNDLYDNDQSLILNYFVPDNPIPDNSGFKNLISALSSSMSNYDILVYYPKVRITNEAGEFTDITDLYIKVSINFDGTLRYCFRLNRGSYTTNELDHDYMHSHIAHIPVDDFECFKNPCTGSGPINGTISTLEFKYDLDIWGLFCTELDVYVHVESLAGVPYHHLANLNSYGNDAVMDNYFACVYNSCRSDSIVRSDFFNWYLENNDLNFVFNNNQYTLNISFMEYLLNISNSFIHWANDISIYAHPKTLSRNYMYEAYIKDDKLYYVNRSGRVNDEDSYKEYESRTVCTFKGETIKLKIIKNVDNNFKSLLILEPKISLQFLNKLLEIINYNYGREERTKAIEISKNVVYL